MARSRVNPIPRLPRKIAFISDTHGDLVALQKVISDLETVEDIDEVLVGGDLAQGGAQPAEVVDEIRNRAWPSVRGNSDDLLIRIADGISPAEALHEAEGTHGGPLPESVAVEARRSVGQLGPERVEYLRALPTAIVRGPFEFGTVVLVHATPWSTEDVVLPDADLRIARRMVREARARLLLYGHIHTPYQRRVGKAALASIGAVSSSNDGDPRPAYTIVSLGSTITVETRRVDWPSAERLAAYKRAGVERRFSDREPGPFPVRSQPGVPVTVWP